jgi:membrane fusion protein, multidrug efflux system
VEIDMDAITVPKTLGDSKHDWHPRALKRATIKQAIVVGLLGAALLAACGYGYYWWTVASYFQGTDDAYVGGNVTPIAPHISGFVEQILVSDNQEVKADQLLIRLDDRDVRAAAGHAEAVLTQREATLASLRAKDELQQSTIEQASADLNAKIAQADFAKVDAQRYRELAETRSGYYRMRKEPLPSTSRRARPSPPRRPASWLPSSN